MRIPVALVCSLDVEEEGLFRWVYRRRHPPVTNLACLHRLEGLLRLGVRPTLFCAHPVLADDGAWRHVEALASRHAVEIGAHLHHWNTPPLDEGDPATTTTSVASRLVPDDLLARKIDTVLEAARQRTGRRPTSFRMGRWDLRAGHWKLLADAGILADASVRPLHARDRRGLRPDHFRAPRAPYLVPAQGRVIFELPLTATPLAGFLPRLVDVDDPGAWEGDGTAEGFYPGWAREHFHAYGALVLLPVEHPLWAMKAVTRLAVARGCRCLSLTWHSSEMMAGGNPRMATQRAVDAFLRKLERYVLWLCGAYAVTFRTLEECRRAESPSAPVLQADQGDWSTPVRHRAGAFPVAATPNFSPVP